MSMSWKGKMVKMFSKNYIFNVTSILISDGVKVSKMFLKGWQTVMDTFEFINWKQVFNFLTGGCCGQPLMKFMISFLFSSKSVNNIWNTRGVFLNFCRNTIYLSLFANLSKLLLHHLLTTFSLYIVTIIRKCHSVFYFS